MFISDKSGSEHKVRIGERKLTDRLDRYYSTKKLGSFIENGDTIFRLFAPSTKDVTLITFKKPEDDPGVEYAMKRDEDGVWEYRISGEHQGLFYGFKVDNPKTQYAKDIICLDPYAKAVASFNSYLTPRRAIVVKEDNFDWEGDESIQRDWRDLIIYEMHIKDMTVDPFCGCEKPGTYEGLIEKNKNGGIDYIKKLGVNTVEIMPCQEFAHIEIPYKNHMNGRYNEWNPYERNYWGYMTAAFFAPDEYYDYSGDYRWNEWTGTDARQITSFKNLVKAFHKENIAVIMDVVYNHLSEYELGNLKEIDKEYYFRLDGKGNYQSVSGCGNDLKTERPMVRRLISDSVLYWMKEYHIDGFRFDLGNLIDWETVEEITREAVKINPDVILVCEPWGGGYDPSGFSVRGWGSWNDQIRNGIKGENPYHGLGWIFGQWYGNNNPHRINNYINGTVERDSYGLFQKKEHSVNYLSSHDGYTLGDFIRIATNSVESNDTVKDIDDFVKLTAQQLQLNKLAALFLFTAQGIVMFQEGDEFARTKVIPLDTEIPDENKGRIDHNSYNKDNTTNYIHYKHAEINKELVDYYKGLIELRNNYSSFRKARYNEIVFFENGGNPFATGYSIEHREQSVIVLLNSHPHETHLFNLPDGDWEILADKDKAGIQPLRIISGKAEIPPTTGMVLKKK